jgi:hypothetical protein
MHIIATMRSKQEYVQDKNSETGKTSVRKLGLEPEQRKGMEYEFTTFFEINAEHEAFGSKDRTSLFDQKTFKITPKVGETMMKWLDGGVSTEHVVIATAHKADKDAAANAVKTEIIEMCKSLGGSTNLELMAVLKEYTPNGNPNSITDEIKLAELRQALVDLQMKNEETNA